MSCCILCKRFCFLLLERTTKRTTAIAIDVAAKTNTSTPIPTPTPLSSFDGVTVVTVVLEGVPGKRIIQVEQAKKQGHSEMCGLAVQYSNRPKPAPVQQCGTGNSNVEVSLQLRIRSKSERVNKTESHVALHLSCTI